VYVPPNRSEVFKDHGEKPADWDELPRKDSQAKVFEPYPGKARNGCFPKTRVLTVTRPPLQMGGVTGSAALERMLKVDGQ
jgi:hypothetical protein